MAARRLGVSGLAWGWNILYHDQIRGWVICPGLGFGLMRSSTSVWIWLILLVWKLSQRTQSRLSLQKISHLHWRVRMKTWWDKEFQKAEQELLRWAMGKTLVFIDRASHGNTDKNPEWFPNFAALGNPLGIFESMACGSYPRHLDYMV